MISPHEESLEFHKAWGNGGPVKDEAGNLWVSIHKPCQHLKEDGFCDDYENRPQRCRKHPVGPSILFWDTCALMRDKFKREE
jgi:Fe-S-cluster containining protein